MAGQSDPIIETLRWPETDHVRSHRRPTSAGAAVSCTNHPGGLSMTGNRAARVVILAAIAAIAAVAAGCGSVSGSGTSGSDPTDVPTSPEAMVGNLPADTITVGLERAPGGYNSGNATANTVFSHYVDNLTLSNFALIDPMGKVQRNTEFGTYQKVSDDPL